MSIHSLKIGDLEAKYPIIQGGMGVGISLHSLAGAVAKAGGVGIISSAQIGYQKEGFADHPIETNLMAMEEEFHKAKEIAQGGIVGFNIMVATRGYERYVRKAVEIGADLIISGAGLPTNLPEYVKGSNTKIAPIVSSAKSASVILKMWERHGNRLPDLLVIEGPLAGGHLGFGLEQLNKLGADTDDVPTSYQQSEYDEEVRNILKVVKEFEDKYEKKIPVALAGGIYDHNDFLHAMELGVDAVQVATRFVTTEECDAPMSYKQTYINADAKDIVIVKSPVGMPGRAIRNLFIDRTSHEKSTINKCYQCLEKCNPKEIPYCITKALVNAATGNINDALLFCGANAYRANRIEKVADVIKELVGTEEM